MQRQDYTFAHLLEMNNEEKQTKKQQSMFDEKEDEGKFLRRYVTHYRRVQENEWSTHYAIKKGCRAHPFFNVYEGWGIVNTIFYG